MGGQQSQQAPNNANTGNNNRDPRGNGPCNVALQLGPQNVNVQKNANGICTLTCPSAKGVRIAGDVTLVQDPNTEQLVLTANSGGNVLTRIFSRSKDVISRGVQGASANMGAVAVGASVLGGLALYLA